MTERENVPFSEQCDEEMTNPDRGGARLVCNLRMNHPGPHHDDVDRLSWLLTINVDDEPEVTP